MALKTPKLPHPSHLAPTGKTKFPEHELVFIDDGPLASSRKPKSRRPQTDVFKLIIGLDSRYVPSTPDSPNSSSQSTTLHPSQFPVFERILNHKRACLQRLSTSMEEKIFRETEAVVLANDAFYNQTFDVTSTQLFQVQARKNACLSLSRQLFNAHIVSTAWAKRPSSSMRPQEPNILSNQCPRYVRSVLHDSPTYLKSTIKEIENFFPRSRWRGGTKEEAIGIIDNRDSGSPYIFLHISEHGTSYELPCGAAAEIGALWSHGFPDGDIANLADNKTILRVLFLEGSPHQSKVKEYAQYWEQGTSIEFQFVESGESEIRVAFEKGGSWSMLGNQCVPVPQDQPTMNFGWFDESTSDAEFSRTVQHEFGHALGLVHEHSSPAANIPWNKDAVYAKYVQKNPSWSVAQVDYNVFQIYDSSKTYFTDFDPSSIMCYPVFKDETTDGFEIPGNNNVLSIKDKAFAAKCYPRQGHRIILSGYWTSKPDSSTIASPLPSLADFELFPS